MSTPIYDLSYRHYDGPMGSARGRWWAIARAGCAEALKKKGLWVLMALSGWYYMILMITVFVFEQMMAANPMANVNNEAKQFFQRIVWKDQFLLGFSFAQLPYLVMAIMIGAGCIANDNKANALLVYLSKPCTKLDYLIGKWMGIFLPLLLMMAIPTLFFYLYGLAAYTDYGFFKSDPWLFLKIIIVLPLAAAVHSSLILGISSLFNQSRMAGATYAGIYFLTNFASQIGVIGFTNATQSGTTARQVDQVLRNLYYSSVDGLQIALCKGVIGSDGSPMLAVQSRMSTVPAPTLFWPIFFWLVLNAAMVALAWRRVKAVEVVK